MRHDWDSLWEILGDNIERPLSPKATERIEALWLKNKGPLIPYFGPDGRIKAELDHLEPKLPGKEHGGDDCMIPSHAPAWELLGLIDGGLLCEIFRHTPELVGVTVGELLENKLLSSRGKLVPAGFKLTRYVRKVIQAWHKQEDNSDHLGPKSVWLPRDRPREEAFSIMASKVVTSLDMMVKAYHFPMKGTLVLSINPLDLALASESTNGWHTCTSLHHEFPGSITNFVTEANIIIAYFYKTYQNFQGVYMPRKMWRQFVYIFPKYKQACFQREYPLPKRTLSKVTRHLGAKILAAMTHSPYEWSTTYDPQGGVVQEVNWLSIDETSSKITLLPHPKYVPDELELFSEGPICLSCGERKGTVEAADEEIPANSGSLLCRDCWPVCQDCGGAIKGVVYTQSKWGYCCEECIDPDVESY